MQACISDRESALALVSALQKTLTEQGAMFRAPPAEPETCCGRGCNGCVWESYYGAVQFWVEDAEQLLKQSSPSNAA